MSAYFAIEIGDGKICGDKKFLLIDRRNVTLKRECWHTENKEEKCEMRRSQRKLLPLAHVLQSPGDGLGGGVEFWPRPLAFLQNRVSLWMGEVLSSRWTGRQIRFSFARRETRRSLRVFNCNVRQLTSKFWDCFLFDFSLKVITFSLLSNSITEKVRFYRCSTPTQIISQFQGRLICVNMSKYVKIKDNILLLN